MIETIKNDSKKACADANDISQKNKISMWAPLRHKRYRALWICNSLSNIGSWMQAMTAAWLMGSLTSSPLMTGLIQTATNLPIFLFAIIAGTLADMTDRPKFLLIVNIQMAISAFILSIFVIFNLITPWVLLSLIFSLGVGAAFMWPAWQASMSGLVDHSEIPAAATLNGLSYNLASVIGPAIGGLLFGFSGPAVLFLINALSFIGLIVVYYRWWKSPHVMSATNEKFTDALTSGIKAIKTAPKFHSILINTFIMMFTTNAFMSLLPLFVRDVLHKNSDTYGLLMGSLGVGAVLGAFMLPNLRARFSTQKLLSIASVCFSLVLLTLSFSFLDIKLLIPIIVIGGVAWVTIVSSLNAAAQSSFELKLRARALAIYMVVMAGSLSLGGYVWGLLANLYGVNTIFLISSIVLFLSPILALKWSVKIISNQTIITNAK